jgi:hypothetical protein
VQSRLRFWCSVIVALLVSPFAQALELQPGLWEIASKSERDGISRSLPTRSQCLTPEKAKRASSRSVSEISSLVGEKLGSKERTKTCKVESSERTDAELNWQIRCPGQVQAEQIGKIRYDNPRHYTTILTIRMTVGLRTLSSTVTMEGRRTGECPR